MSAGPEKDQEEKNKSRDLLSSLCAVAGGRCCGLKRPWLEPQGLESSMAKI